MTLFITLRVRSSNTSRYFVAVYTDSSCMVGCDHKHENVTAAAACIPQAGGYVVAVRHGKVYQQLTAAEEAEFQRAMSRCEENCAA
ncbi:MAG: hypothetical protein JO356_00610 [Acidobacteria bacterium]|nr:hypothetical protein [Acidobacteriota bacterium]